MSKKGCVHDGLSSVFIFIFIFIFIFLVLMIFLGFSIHKYSTKENEACKDLGYDEYLNGRCIGKYSYMEVEIKCDRDIFPKDCWVIKEDKSN